MKNWTLDSILAPLPLEEFLTKILGRRSAHAGGGRDRFRELLPWKSVNDILTYSGLDAPRLRIEKGGHDIPSSEFCQSGLNGFPRIHVETFYRMLREGATLVVDGMEGLNESVGRLCEAVEQGLEVPVQARFCASWSDGSADSARNDHDVLVLQLTGARVWTVSPHSAPLPWELNSGRGSESSAAGILMEAGDVLYVPRGCSHRADPGDTVESSLVISFRNPTGLQILGRVLDRLRSSPALNTDFPRFADNETQMSYLSFLQSEATRALNEQGLLTGFMKELWAISEARTRISLPFGASSDVLPLSDADALSLSTRFPNEDTLIHTRDSAAAEIVNDRRRTVVDETAQRVLAVLLMRREMTVGELLTESGLLVTLAPVPRRLWGRMESWCAIVNRAVL